jgi:hypothetical protein
MLGKFSGNYLPSLMFLNFGINTFILGDANGMEFVHNNL